MASNGQPSVAIVDDDPSLCRALGRLFSAAGINSIAYSSAEAFLEDQNSPEPGCLILDIQLGGMSGLDLQKSLSAQAREIPVIFITAHDEPEYAEQAERSGCLAYLRKTDPGQLVLENVKRATRLQKTEKNR